MGGCRLRRSLVFQCSWTFFCNCRLLCVVSVVSFCLRLFLVVSYLQVDLGCSNSCDYFEENCSRLCHVVSVVLKWCHIVLK